MQLWENIIEQHGLPWLELCPDFDAYRGAPVCSYHAEDLTMVCDECHASFKWDGEGKKWLKL